MSEKNHNDGRLSFSHFVDQIFYAALTGSVVFAASQMKELSNNVASLNEKMGVVIERLSDQEKRIEYLENKFRR